MIAVENLLLDSHWRWNDFFINIIIASTISIPFIYYISNDLRESIRRVIDRSRKIKSTNLHLRFNETDNSNNINDLSRFLNKMLDRIEATNIRCRQFNSDVTHELRTPLTIMRGEIEIALLKQRSKKEYEQVLVSTLEEVIRLNNLVTTLLELSRAESGKMKMKFTVGNFSAFIEDIAEDAEVLAEVSNIRVSTNIEKNIEINFDSDRMHQAVLNLIDNAVKYTKEDGKIFIDLIKNGQFVVLKIQDTGMGIPLEDQKNIFDRFFRVDAAKLSNIQGSGLGLSIVKFVISAHGGKILVDSVPNEGTTFTVYLPFEFPDEINFS